MIKKVILLLFILFLLSDPVSAVETNLVRNPGFEEGTGEGFYYWTKHALNPRDEAVGFNWDPKVKHSGAKGVCITNKTPNYTAVKQMIPVKKDTRYVLSCWIRTENVGPDNKGANLLVDGIAANDTGDIRGTADSWKLVTLDVKTTALTETLTISLELGGYGNPNTGKAWFDDVAMKETDLYSDPFGKISHNTAGDGSGKTVLVGLLCWFLLSIAALTIIIINGKKTAVNKKLTAATTEIIPKKSSPRFKIDRTDIVIMTLMTLIYLAVAFYKLGGHNIPKTPWTPVKAGESFTVTFDQEYDLSKIYYYCGLGEGKFEVEYRDKAGKFLSLVSLPKKDAWVFMWRSVNVNVKTNSLRIITLIPGATLYELGFFQKGSQTPILITTENKAGDPRQSSLKNLFDEPALIEYPPSHLTETYFDEVHHTRTAYEYLHRIHPHEDTHPPLGKILIALGVAVLGMNPFGWRIVGTLFGVAMIPLMYFFGLKLFGRRFYAFCAAFLMMFDFMHFEQSRIGTVDVYAVTFIILMYYYMYDYWVHKSYHLGFKQSLKPLLWCGIFFGLGAATKWICLYAGVGLALLFFWAKYREYRDYLQIVNSGPPQKPEWVREFIPLYLKKTLIYCALFFIVIPLAIYLVSYIPFMLTPGHSFTDVIENQGYMLNFHSTNTETHRFSAEWWEWPLITKPMWFFNGQELPGDKVASIVAMGNPAIWWLGILALVVSFVIMLKKRDYKILVIFIAFAFQYLPWTVITRSKFIYHFFSAVPFLILALVYMFKFVIEKYPKSKYIIYSYLIVVVILFVLFYPVLSGMVIDKSYVNQYLSWFKGWIF